MKRARGISKLPKVGRERKMEPKTENKRAYRIEKERLPEIAQGNEDQSLPARKQRMADHNALISV